MRHGYEVRSVHPTTGDVEVRADDDEYGLTACEQAVTFDVHTAVDPLKIGAPTNPRAVHSGGGPIYRGLVRRVFLFSDIVGSTRLWAEDPDSMQADLAAHDDLMRSVFSAHDGVVFANAGDSFGVAFGSPSAAVDAAIEVQRLMVSRTWTVDGCIAVRIGIHTGSAHERNDNFYGPTLNETARIMSVGHGGQVILSAAVNALLALPTTPLGEHRLRDLAGRWPLFQVDIPGSDNRHPPLNSLGDHRSTLPVQGTGLIGRDGVIDDARKALRTHRLVTVIGPGGGGKTRVAIEAAGRSIADFPGGAYFVDLTTLTDPATVYPAFVDGLARAVPPDRTPAQHVFSTLGGPPAIVVVDNCEHVVDAIAAFLVELLAAAPAVRVIATSRVPLELTEEHTLALPPLGAETGDSSAVQLFVERALAADPAFEFDVASLETVTRITQRLDGMPLAIELAAARIQTLTPARILANLDDRFRLLVRARHRDGRHGSLEATIAWSYEMLEPEEQRAFRSLAVCGGAVTLSTASALLGCDDLAAVDLLESLIHKSLVHVSVSGPTERGYRLLESTRAFGTARLDELGDLEATHLVLEAALVPSQGEITNDYLAFSDAYCDWNERTVIEAATRRAAAARADADGRYESAAILYVTATSPEEPGAHQRMLTRVQELQSHADELSPGARTALWAAQVWLHTFTFQMMEMMTTAIDALAAMPTDDPSRRLFEAYRLLALTPVDPDAVIAETDKLVPDVLEQVTRSYDYSLAFIFLARSIALLAVQRIEEAREAARSAVRWVAPGTGGYHSALSHLLWMEHTEGLGHGPEFELVKDFSPTDFGLQQIRIAVAISSDAAVEERAARLAALARSRPLGGLVYEESLFSVPFAWLAIEEGDFERAQRLLDAFATIDPGSGTAGVRALELLARVTTGEGLTTEALLLHLFGPTAPDRLRRTIPAVLNEELAYWDARFAAAPDRL